MKKKLNYIKEIRKSKGMTQDQVAEALGISQAQVQRHESGMNQITLFWLEKYANLFLCDEKELILGPEKNNELIAEATTILQGFSSKDQEKFVDMLKLFAKKDDE